MFRSLKLCILPILAFLSLCLPGRTQQALQVATTSRKIVFLMVATSDHVTGLTGLVSGTSLTVTLSKNGAAFASPAGTVAELSSGWYVLSPTVADSGTNGPLLLHASGTGADPTDKEFNVVSYNPDDSSALGLSALTSASAQATAANTRVQLALPAIAPGAAGGLPTDTQIVADVQSGLTAQGYTAVRGPYLDKINSFLTAAAPTTAQIQAALFTVPGRLLAVDALGNVAAGNLPTDYQQRGVAVTLPALPNVVVGSYAAGQDPATLVLDTAASGHNIALSVGSKINSAGTAADPWATLLPGAYGAGTAGNIVGNRLDAAVSSRMATFGLPANFAALVINGSGLVRHDLTQPLDLTNLGDTVGGALVGARAQAFGKWTIVGNLLTMYAADGTTVVKTFTIAPTPTASSRQ